MHYICNRALQYQREYITLAIERDRVNVGRSEHASLLHSVLLSANAMQSNRISMSNFTLKNVLFHYIWQNVKPAPQHRQAICGLSEDIETSKPIQLVRPTLNGAA